MAPTNASRRSGTHRRTVATLVAVSVYTVAAAGFLWWFEGAPTIARVPLAIPLLLFAPGYAVVAALFPPSGPDALDSRLERGIIAIVASIAIVPMAVLATTVAGPLDLGLILACIAGVTVAASAVGIGRDLYGGTGAHRSSRYDDSAGDGSSVRHVATDGVTILAVLVAASLLVASAAVAYTGESADQLMTEFYFADEPGTVTDDGDLEPFDLRINHHAGGSQEYSIVVLRDDGTDAASWSELDRSSITVDPDETAAITYRTDGSELDGNDTVRFLLYTDEAPSSPDPETAHRALSASIDSADE